MLAKRADVQQRRRQKKIGVDARLLAYPLTGIGRYTHEMTQALLRAGAHLVLYMPSAPIHPLYQDRGGLELNAARLSGRAGRFIWGQAVLPFTARSSAPDVYWGPTHRIPPFLPKQTRAFVTIHDLVWKAAGDTMRPTSRLLEKTLMPMAVRRADGIIAVSDHTKRDIISAFPETNSPIRTIYPGLAERAPAHPPSHLEKWSIHCPYILFVGTLEPRKNLARLLTAFAKLRENEHDQVDLVIAGGAGWGDIDLVQMIQELRIANFVHMTGYVEESELSTLYQNALFLAMPSLYEGFGLPLIEAMSYGLPSLTSNVSSMPEVAADTAVLVDPLSVDAMVDGLRILTTDHERRKYLGRRAEERALLFRWDVAAHQLLDFFQLNDDVPAAERP